ncbi:MAG TPA: pilus assembly protein [Caulobacteraceae bacterium]
MLSLIRKFWRNRRANVAVTFAVAALPVSMMVGMGIDITNASRVKLALQDATDEAALSLARQQSTIADSAIATTAQSYVMASYNKTAAIQVTNATIDRTNIIATIDDQATVPMFFSQMFGVSTMTVKAHAVAQGLQLEVSLVLDTSGSMADSAGSGGSKIVALRTAVADFLSNMFGSQTTSQRVSVGIVPFATSVRVAAAGSTPSSSYMDTTGKEGDPYADLDSTKYTRFALFTQMNQSWGGCVMTRPPPYDVTDDAPTTSKPATLFIPWFAPDEPDTNLSYGYTDYENNYISDSGGACGNGNGLSDLKKEQRTCKYKNARPSSGLGPNYLCVSNAITPLTSTLGTLTTATNALQANGNTNLLEGVTWGWRVLSPGQPFTEGKAYGAPNNRKVIILMTDGMNNYGGENNMNDSSYFTYGFARKGLIGQVTNNNNTLDDLLDAKTLTACTNAKAMGIVIYTIGFGSGADGSAGLLKSCASDPSYYYAPENSSDLDPVFQQIAQSINNLRISQ